MDADITLDDFDVQNDALNETKVVYRRATLNSALGAGPRAFYFNLPKRRPIGGNVTADVKGGVAYTLNPVESIRPGKNGFTIVRMADQFPAGTRLQLIVHYR